MADMVISTLKVEGDSEGALLVHGVRDTMICVVLVRKVYVVNEASEGRQAYPLSTISHFPQRP